LEIQTIACVGARRLFPTFDADAVMRLLGAIRQLVVCAATFGVWRVLDVDGFDVLTGFEGRQRALSFRAFQVRTDVTMSDIRGNSFWPYNVRFPPSADPVAWACSS